LSNLIARVTKIDSESSLNIISFNFCGTTLKMMSLELSDEVSVGKKVMLSIKGFSVAIAKNFSGELSYSNQIKTTVDSITQGKLLCSLKLLVEDEYIESIITTESLKRLNIKVGDNVIALIKANEVSIVEIL